MLENYILPEWDLPYGNEIYGHFAVYGSQDGLVIDDHLIGTADASDYLDGGAGNDTIEGLGGYDELTGGAGNDSVSSVGGTGGTPFYPQSSLYGDQGNDTLISGDATDVLEGGTGDDLLIGGGGDDNLNGDFGADTLDGGTGDDTLTAGDGAFDDVMTAAKAKTRLFLRAFMPNTTSQIMALALIPWCPTERVMRVRISSMILKSCSLRMAA